MDGSQLLRLVRRRAGISQRQLAEQCGIAVSTVQAVEAGRRGASEAVLTKACHVAGLELSVEPVPPLLGADVVAYLRGGLTQRLHLALGVRRRPYMGGATPVWRQLVSLVQVARVVLHGELAEALWLPVAAPLTRIEVCLRRHDTRAGLPAVPDVALRKDCPAHPVRPMCVPVSVPLESWLVLVDPPAELATAPEHAAERGRLRAVARLLHEQAVRDESGRRVRAHRDPEHRREMSRVRDTLRYGSLPVPETTDMRSWRLDDDAGFLPWLRRYGYPD